MHVELIPVHAQAHGPKWNSEPNRKWPFDRTKRVKADREFKNQMLNNYMNLKMILYIYSASNQGAIGKHSSWMVHRGIESYCRDERTE